MTDKAVEAAARAIIVAEARATFDRAHARILAEYEASEFCERDAWGKALCIMDEERGK